MSPATSVRNIHSSMSASLQYTSFAPILFPEPSVSTDDIGGEPSRFTEFAHKSIGKAIPSPAQAGTILAARVSIFSSRSGASHDTLPPESQLLPLYQWVPVPYEDSFNSPNRTFNNMLWYVPASPALFSADRNPLATARHCFHVSGVSIPCVVYIEARNSLTPIFSLPFSHPFTFPHFPSHPFLPHWILLRTSCIIGKCRS